MAGCGRPNTRVARHAGSVKIAIIKSQLVQRSGSASMPYRTNETDPASTASFLNRIFCYENQIKAGVVKVDPACTQLTVHMLHEWLAKACSSAPPLNLPNWLRNKPEISSLPMKANTEKTEHPGGHKNQSCWRRNRCAKADFVETDTITAGRGRCNIKGY